MKKIIKEVKKRMKTQNQKRKGEKHKLNDLQDGEYGKIVSYKNNENRNKNQEEQKELRRYLMSMGFVEGAEIKFIKKAPLGDPCKVRIKGYDLALRKEEAKNIEVKIN